MSQGMRETIEILASLSGSFLLLLVFLLLVAACVLLWLLGRGLKLARMRSAAIATWIVARVEQGEIVAERSARELIEPQIRVLSAWTGAKAGVSALLHGPGRGREEARDPLEVTDRPAAEPGSERA